MENKNIIPAALLNDVESLINGAKITAITDDLQCDNIVSLGKSVRAVRIELEKTGKANVEPLYKVYKEAQSFVADKVDALKAVEKNISDVTGKYQHEKEEAARIKQAQLIEEAKQKQLALAEDRKSTRLNSSHRL